MDFEQIAKTQETIDLTIKTLKENFEKAEAVFADRKQKVLAALAAQQTQEATHLAQIGKALEEIIGEKQV